MTTLTVNLNVHVPSAGSPYITGIQTPIPAGASWDPTSNTLSVDELNADTVVINLYPDGGELGHTGDSYTIVGTVSHAWSGDGDPLTLTVSSLDEGESLADDFSLVDTSGARDPIFSIARKRSGSPPVHTP